MKMKALGAALVVTMLVAACGGGGGDPGKSPFEQTTATNTTTGGTSTSTNSSGSLVVTLSSRTVSSSAPGVVTALVKDASGNPVPFAVVTFAVTNASLASLGSPSGLTDASGYASTTISPNPSATTGATTVTASVTLPGTTTALTAQYAFSVAVTNVTLTSATPAVNPLTAYASTSIAVVVSAASSSAPVTLTASSTCASQNKATISPTTLVLTGTTGSFTYQDKGCGTSDQVTVQIQGTSQTQAAAINVLPPAATALTFVSATPDELCLMGSGCAGTSNVKFKVIDSGGNGIPIPQTVDFSLTQTGSATLSTTSGVTDSNGEVTVVVRSGIVPTPVRVTAALHSDPTIKTVSNSLTVLSGLPYQSGVTFAAETYTLNRNLIGDSTSLTVRLVDRFGNPVKDGTPVNFMTEGGSVTPGTCSTADGECSVNFVVQNPIPSDGRITVVAYSLGEEDFVDTDNSNTYDAGETISQLGQVILDSDEDNALSPGERVVGSVANTTWDSNNYVRDRIFMVMSNTVLKPRLYTVTGGATPTCTNTAFTGTALSLNGGCTDTVKICVRDGNTDGDNPIVSGSALSVAVDVTDATAIIDGTPISTTDSEPTIHTLTVSRKTCSTALAANGSATLTIKVKGKDWTFPEAPISIAK